MKWSSKALFTLGLFSAGCFLAAASAAAAAQGDAKPARPKVALFAGGAAGDVEVLRGALGKLPSVRFKADELKFGDFARDGGLFTGFFDLDIGDLNKADIGPIARAVAAAGTSRREQAPPALFLILKYRPDSVKTAELRSALAKVEGVHADRSWAGDANLWVSVDASGQARLADITRALHAASVRFRDPILDIERP
jgi:hypothetical protein